MLKATYGSDKTPLLIGNLKIPCYVLENEMAVLSLRGMQEAIGFKKKSSGDKLTQIIQDKNIVPFINKELLENLANPIKFKRFGAGGAQPITYGYEATTLIDICYVLIDANKKSALKPHQTFLAEQAEIVVRAFAKTGIVAVIYEITGFEKDKQKDAYQKYLEKFIRKEYAAWVKRFPIKFFELMCDLKGWEYEKNKTHYYSAMGHVINDVIYKRLAPSILDELKKVNPVIKETGRRKVKHFQWLTDEVGVPSLAEHLIGVMALASANSDWRKFYSQLNRVYPQYNAKQLDLDFTEEEE